MKEQLQTILIKEDALREEARQKAIIEASKKASKNRKTNNYGIPWQNRCEEKIHECVSRKTSERGA